MPSNHLILCHPPLFLPSIFPSIRVFSDESVLHTEKAMTTHSSSLAWKIPWAEEPGRLQSMGSQRVRHDRVTSLSLFTFMHWRRKWQPTPVFLPGESQGRGSLVHVQMWSLGLKEGWALKNWCFQIGVKEKILESPLDCKEIKQSILKKINPEYSLERLMLKLKLQYSGHLMWRDDSLEKTLVLGKDWRQKEKGAGEDEMVR